MIPRWIFLVALRVLGLVFLWRSLEALPIAGAVFCDAAPRGEVLAMILSVAEGAAPLLVAYWLLRGAPSLVRLAYPARQRR